MNTTKQAPKFSAQRLLDVTTMLFLGVVAAVASMLRPNSRRSLAAAGAAVGLAAGSLLAAQPAAADTSYPVNVTFDSVSFTLIDDGTCGFGWYYWCTDTGIEVYGTLGAYTTAGVTSAAGGLAYRLFGKWGQSPSGCPEHTHWGDNANATCPKWAYWDGIWPHKTTEYLWDTLLCRGSYYQTCATGYSKNNSTIPVQVRPGEKLKVTVAMQDHDSASGNDDVCVGHLWFGPYTAEQLQYKKFATSSQIFMADNGHAQCEVRFHLS
jgi:hypothetical protein